MESRDRRKWAIAGSTSALGAGSLAALLGACCGAPWLVAAIGVTGAIAVARLAFLAPYLWLLALVFAGGVLVWAYRTVPTCDASCTAQSRRGRLLAAWIVALATIGLFVAARGWRVWLFVS